MKNSLSVKDDPGMLYTLYCVGLSIDDVGGKC
jgi:hypothetical protein